MEFTTEALSRELLSFCTGADLYRLLRTANELGVFKILPLGHADISESMPGTAIVAMAYLKKLSRHVSALEFSDSQQYYIALALLDIITKTPFLNFTANRTAEEKESELVAISGLMGVMDIPTTSDGNVCIDVFHLQLMLYGIRIADIGRSPIAGFTKVNANTGEVSTEVFDPQATMPTEEEIAEIIKSGASFVVKDMEQPNTEDTPPPSTSLS